MDLEANAHEEYIYYLFKNIAGSYDLFNAVLSLGLDKYWRRAAVKYLSLEPGMKVLDVCCGTGRLALEEAQRIGPPGYVVGLDFSEAMLEKARHIAVVSGLRDRAVFLKGNAFSLPFASDSFDVVTISFGLRNLLDRSRALQEMVRVLKPSSKLLSLELVMPDSIFMQWAYHFYWNMISFFLHYKDTAVKEAYAYLKTSIFSFPGRRQLHEEFRQAKLVDIGFRDLCGGIAYLQWGRKKAG